MKLKNSGKIENSTESVEFGLKWKLNLCMSRFGALQYSGEFSFLVTANEIEPCETGRNGISEGFNYRAHEGALEKRQLTFSKAPFMWRKVVVCKRVTLSPKSTLASVYMRKKLTPLPESRAGFLMTTVLTHALVILPWLSWLSWASQSVFMEKSWPSWEGRPTIERGWRSYVGNPSSQANFLFLI